MGVHVAPEYAPSSNGKRKGAPSIALEKSPRWKLELKELWHGASEEDGLMCAKETVSCGFTTMFMGEVVSEIQLVPTILIVTETVAGPSL